MNLTQLNRYYIASIFSFLLLFSCQVDNEITSKISISSADDVLDSLMLGLNTNVLILELESGERKLVVHRDQKKIGENAELIGCKSCGYQSGDPYVSLQKEEGGFRVFLENEIYSFTTENENVYLKEVDFLLVEHTNDGVLEKHIVKNRTNFGEIRLDDLTREMLAEYIVVEPTDFKKVFEASNVTQLPLKYSYSFVVDLIDFVTVKDVPDFTEFTYLSDFKFSKLLSTGNINVLLVSGHMKSGQSEMFLVTLNEEFEAVDYLKLYSHQEIEAGGVLTKFNIGKDYKIAVIREEMIDRNTRVLEEKLFEINTRGTFVQLNE